MYVMRQGKSCHQICENHAGCALRRGSHRTPPGREGLKSSECWALSSVQARILEGIAAGSSSGMLSRELFLSSKTIEYHVRILSGKLQAPNRVAMISRAFVLEILRTDSWPPRVACETVD